MDPVSSSGGGELARVLDDKTLALVRLGALIATGGGTSCYGRHVATARAAGATDEEVVAVLLAVAPTVGLAGLSSATSQVALGLGYDVDDGFERLAD